MADVMYDPQDKPLAAKVTRGNLAVNKPERVTVTGYEAGVNGTGQPVLKLVCYPVGQPSFQEAIQITTDRLAPLMTAAQYDALEKQSMNSCDIDIELVKVAGFSLNPYRISKLLRGEIVAKKQEKPAETSDNIDDYLEGLPDDDRPCMNEWAIKDTLRAAFWKACRELFPDAKDIRAKVLPMFGVKDEFAIKHSVPDALAYLRKHADIEAASLETEPITPPIPAPAVEVTVKETKPVEKPQQTEASVIIFAKSDIFLTLPSGATVTLSVTLRDGADFGEVKRLIDVYTQMLSLPNVTTARPAPIAQPVAPAPQPAAPAPQQTAPASNGERISKVVSGVKVAFDEKGQKNLQLYGRYGDNWGTGPDHTCRKAEEMAIASAVAGVAMDNLAPGEIVQVTPFTVTWTKGKETKPGSGRFYHDNPTFARN